MAPEQQQQQQQQQQQLVEAPLSLSKYSRRVLLQTIVNRPDGGVGLIGQRVVVGGWVKSSREFRKEPVPLPLPTPASHHVHEPQDVTCVEVLQSRLPFFWSIFKVFGGGGEHHRIKDKLDAIVPKPPQPSISILQISDGSCVSSLQVLVDSALASPSDVMPTGTSILAEGIIQKASLQGKQTIELKTEKILFVGLVDHERYPLSKKRLPLELLRDSAHFRPRTTTVASVMRIRSSLAQAQHTFFHANGFLHVQLPIITSTNCDGKREIFHVTTLLGKEKMESTVEATDGVKLEAIKASIRDKTKQVEELKRNASNKEALAASIHDLKKTTELISHLETKQKAKPIKFIDTKRVNFSEDFFSGQMYLTNNGRLHLESYASALGNVYSFGPRFNASKIHSSKALAEMWMVELEMAFAELEESMECASDFLKFMCKYLLDNCTEDLKFVAKRVDKYVVDRLQLVAVAPFEKISYTEAVNVLKQVTKKKFAAEVEWGSSLTEEHESYLTDEVYKKPLIIYNHPKELKPFYVKLNADGRTVAAFDVIVPKVGTMIKGSQSEDRFSILNSRIKELGLEEKQYEWYLDLRKNGTVTCSGFNFLFDPLVLFATGLNDIRDAVPFPRSFGKANN